MWGLHRLIGLFVVVAVTLALGLAGAETRGLAKLGADGDVRASCTTDCLCLSNAVHALRGKDTVLLLPTDGLEASVAPSLLEVAAAWAGPATESVACPVSVNRRVSLVPRPPPLT